MKGENNAFLIYQDDKGVLNVNAVREPTVYGGEPKCDGAATTESEGK
jgi:hypothetical protein